MPSTTVWNDKAPIRSELFSVDRLMQHAESLAVAQTVADERKMPISLIDRLNDNSKVLLDTYRFIAKEAETGEITTPAMEWLLGNYHVIESQIWEIRINLPNSYYRQLPKLATGPFAGYPRVFGIAWAYVAHTDSRFDRESLLSFLHSYQKVQPLTIGELWAISTTLRIVLIENLRRLADQIYNAARLRKLANEIADTILGIKKTQVSPLDTVLESLRKEPLSLVLVEQLAKRFRDPDPRIIPIQAWLEEHLHMSNQTLESLIHDAQQLQYATNISVQNIVVSMRTISDIDWSEMFENVSLVDKALRQHSNYSQLDFVTRNMYRTAIEDLARYSGKNELNITARSLEAANSVNDPLADACIKDPGYYLIGKGRHAFEEMIGYKPPFWGKLYRLAAPLGAPGYVAATTLITILLLFFMVLGANVVGISGREIPLLILFALLPASEAAIALTNLGISKTVRAYLLPAFEMKDGIPENLRTMVVIPTLLLNEEGVREQVRQLEVHYLTGTGAESEVYYALLTDWKDASSETIESDETLLKIASEAVEELNQRYGSGRAGERFALYHRKRLFNSSEGCWMGWERKRGKLEEFIHLLLGKQDTTYIPVNGKPITVPENVRYIVTLDSDTRLPMGCVNQLVGKMAHPLNHACFDPEAQRIVSGYGIMQPRVTPAFPVDRESSLYQVAFSAPGGQDPYASAVSDVYQDLFGEGSFTGKGILDVQALKNALSDRICENQLLSHDLFEGIFARAAFASDIEVIEESPDRYDVASKRQHRWVRGDWQLLPWIFSLKRPSKGGVPFLGRWKMLDNLRRSLVAPMTFLAFVAVWFLPTSVALPWTLFLLFTIALPTFFPLLFAIIPHQSEVNRVNHFRVLRSDFALASYQVGLHVTFLADQAYLMTDAIIRTLYRLFISHKHMLEWVSSMQVEMNPKLTVIGYYRRMIVSVMLSFLILVVLKVVESPSWWIAMPFLVLWISAPIIARRVSWAPETIEQQPILEANKRALHLIMRNTWRFFETFITPQENMLPPDNYQEAPEPVVALRTSPTNIGLYLLSTVAARDLGWLSTSRMIERVEATFATLEKLERFKGHFYNWYDIRSLQVLSPPYVSTVDSGNLAGHLIVLANACEERIGSFITSERTMRNGLRDNTMLALKALEALIASKEDISISEASFASIAYACRDILKIINAKKGSQWATLDLEAIQRQSDTIIQQLGGLKELANTSKKTVVEDAVYWLETIEYALEGYQRDQKLFTAQPEHWISRLQKLADKARRIAQEMEFGFLFNKERQLLSIGFNGQQNILDTSCYDLLASEARLTSMFAIAKGDLPVKHWFRLGRSMAPIGKGTALMAWSGSMFEYLMPSLVLKEPTNSLLGRTNTLIVNEQKAYGHSLGIPWGISESGYSARDVEYTYQYSNFGVPSLGLKRGLEENTVIAPYATGLATMIDPQGATENYARLAKIGAEGRYGFYEAVDFTESRLAEGQKYEIVYSHMAHHQGMTIVAIANILQGGRMRARFHNEPMIQAAELLLQERVPRDVVIFEPETEQYQGQKGQQYLVAHTIRKSGLPYESMPIMHTLSNGFYSIMVTSAGSGLSLLRDCLLTRWRNDQTQDCYGSYFFLKDVDSEEVWSSTYQPTRTKPDKYEVIFAEDRAEFNRTDGDLTTQTEILVSAENNTEVRRVSLINHGTKTRTIEVTSYQELALSALAADVAHPVFSKMFIQTEYVPELDALIATRRKRAPTDRNIFVAHVAAAEENEIGITQYETDRARFLGRGNTIDKPQVIYGKESLSGTTGTVLDPIFSLRKRIKIAPGKKVSISFWTMVSESWEELIDLIDKHRTISAYERVSTLAWTQAQVQLRHIRIDTRTAADFQRLAGFVLYGNPQLRPPAYAIQNSMGHQGMLWPHGISGDLPIIAIRIDDVEDIALVEQIIQAQEYWRMKGWAIDIVIVNERAASYIQDLQHAIETAVRAGQFGHSPDDQGHRGSIYVLRGDYMTLEARALIYSVARIVLNARKGLLERQLALLEELPVPLVPRDTQVNQGTVLKKPDNLEFFNGYGGFADGGREYVIILENGQTTPAPWINVVANEGFGFQVSADGAGYTWNVNSREFKITPWSNDPVSDPSGELIYIRDIKTGALFSPTPVPLRDNGTYIIHHGRGYSRFEHEVNGISMDLTQFVPREDSVKISRLKLTNKSNETRQLSVTAYVEWLLGANRGAEISYVQTEVNKETNALFASNPWNIPFGQRIAFLDMQGAQESWTGDRTAFMGRNGVVSKPKALLSAAPLNKKVGACLDPCGALQRTLTLEPGQDVEVIITLGATATREVAETLVKNWRENSIDEELKTVVSNWDQLLNAVQVKTPDRAMDIMLNGWLLYQAYACRILARSAFYQSSGAYGFRDQLQDGMALTFLKPEMTRSHLIRAAGRQFVEGDVQHWWLPHSGQGVRTKISDDRVWLSYCTATYILTSGDKDVLDEPIPFLEGQILKAEEHDAFYQPHISSEIAPLFEHCARGLDQCIKLTGKHGLPLIGTGDWNDGMNLVGEKGIGESTWLGWLFIATVRIFSPLVEERDPERVAKWREHAEKVLQALESFGWDGEWYRRGVYDDGALLGSADSDECQIDSIAQSWSVLSKAADSRRARVAMDALEKHLIRPELKIACLFTPPFDKTQQEPGYIKGYPPGLRENGGQYSHAAMWAIIAFAELKDGDRAANLFAMLNPVNHALTQDESNLYRVEPYVVAADVYSVSPHAGRGGWTWYTGAAGWMYRAGVESIVGMTRRGDFLRFDPSIPGAWPEVEVQVKTRDTSYHVLVMNPSGFGSGIRCAELNGEPLELVDGVVLAPLDGGTHKLVIWLGAQERRLS